MAYNPPHRRHSKDTNSSSPFPALQSSPYPFPTPSRLQKNNTHPNCFTGPTWLVVPFDDEDVKLPSSIKLKEFPCKLMAPRQDIKSMILVSGTDHSEKDTNEIINKNPSVSVMEKIRQALLGYFQIARDEMCIDGPVQNVPHVLFRFGKVLFHERKSFSISFDNIYKSSIVEAALNQFDRTFFTSVPISFRETIVGETTQKVGLDFEKETDYYSVKVSDIYQPGNTITCKCTVIQDVGGLQLHKVVMGDERRFIADMSCLDKNVDLRLRVSSKRILTLTASENLSLIDLLKSVVIDSEAKGGVRWPLGNKSVDGRYSIVQIFHSKTRVFRNSSMKLKVRPAESFDLQSETGEVAHEVSLTMTELNRMLRDRTLEVNPMVDVVRDAMKLIWDYFLCWEGSFT